MYCDNPPPTPERGVLLFNCKTFELGGIKIYIMDLLPGLKYALEMAQRCDDGSVIMQCLIQNLKFEIRKIENDISRERS